MSLKRRMLAGLAATGLVGGGMAFALPHANAATQKCGLACETLASQKFGVKNVVSVQGSAAGLAAFWYSNNEDLIAWPVGTVHDYYLAHLIAQSVDKVYGASEVFEYEWVPRGSESVRCLGASSSQSGAAVTMQQCGASAATLWIPQAGRQSGNYMPLINAGASAKTLEVLTASTASGPLSITQLSLTTKVANGVSTTSVAPTQMWELETGVYGAATETSVTTGTMAVAGA